MSDQVIPGTLRDRLADGGRFSLHEALVLVVPLCRDLGARHAAGETFLVHPSSLRFEAGLALDPELARSAPPHSRDHYCLPPEHKDATGGDARSSVYSIGAVLYEMVTGEHIGPAMRRPSEVVPTIPDDFEAILGKALVGDPEHRPADLGALASALENIDTSGHTDIDIDVGVDVDVSMSLLPPAPTPELAGSGPLDVRVVDASRKGPDAVMELTSLKARLESDTRPRYVVVKDGMDHGPFSAVELLQQIASNTFKSEDLLRDSISNEAHLIGEWEEFSPFAEQANLNRHDKAERAALEVAVKKEQKSTRSKAAIGVGVVAALLVAVGVAVFAFQASRRAKVKTAQTDDATSMDSDATMKAAKKKKKAGGRGVAVSKGGVPMLSGGMSCYGARKKYFDVLPMGKDAPAMATSGQYQATVQAAAGRIQSCGISGDVKVNICAAIQNGRAVGVTVSTKPSKPGVNRCVDRIVRGLSFTATPYLDISNVWLHFH